MAKVLGVKVNDEAYYSFKELSGGDISSLLRLIIYEYIQNHSRSNQQVNLTETPVNLSLAAKTEQDVS